MLMTSLARDASALGSIEVEVEAAFTLLFCLFVNFYVFVLSSDLCYHEKYSLVSNRYSHPTPNFEGQPEKCSRFIPRLLSPSNYTGNVDAPFSSKNSNILNPFRLLLLHGQPC